MDKFVPFRWIALLTQRKGYLGETSLFLEEAWVIQLDTFFIIFSLLKWTLRFSYIIFINFSEYISPSDREIYLSEERLISSVVALSAL